MERDGQVPAAHASKPEVVNLVAGDDAARPPEHATSVEKCTAATAIPASWNIWQGKRET